MFIYIYIYICIYMIIVLVSLNFENMWRDKWRKIAYHGIKLCQCKVECICTYKGGAFRGNIWIIPLSLISTLSYMAVIWRSGVDPKWLASDTISLGISRGQLGWKSTNTKTKTMYLRKDISYVKMSTVRRDFYACPFMHTYYTHML